MTTPATPSYSCGPYEAPLLDETIGANFDAAAAAFPDRDALVEHTTGRRWTYRELAGKVNAVALVLQELGRCASSALASSRTTR